MSTIIGLRDLHYAILTEDSSGNETYATPKRIAGIVQANINPNPRISTLFADDGPMEAASTLGEIELEIGVGALSLKTQATLLGHMVTGEIIERRSSDTPPWLAIGFKSLKSSGKYKYVWLLKGKFMVPERRHETRGAEITFQTETISGRFVRRNKDRLWILEADEDITGTNATMLSSWFNQVDPAS